MNKPKVVRIEKKESSSVVSWKQVAYEYYTYWNGSWKVTVQRSDIELPDKCWGFRKSGISETLRAWEGS
jgi:hypothetical protein